MRVVEILLELLGKILPSLLVYKAGRDSSKLTRLEDEAKLVDEYSKIDNKKVSDEEVRDSNSWK